MNEMDIGDNIRVVRKRIRNAATRSRRSPEDVTVIAVTKTHPAEIVDEAIGLGIEHIGENRVQEALAKHGDVKQRAVWHMIGHLQRNKVKQVLTIFDIIHSVDSVRLATEIDNRADRTIDVFVEVNIGGEEAKSGVHPDKVIPFLKELRSFDNLRCRGLMAIPPIQAESEDARPYFQELSGIQRDVNRQSIFEYPLQDLSMGMTDDFEIAIEEGATIVRIGRAIFGARKQREPEH